MTMRCRSYGWTLALAICAGSASAQVTLDGTLGRAGTLPGPHYAITADLGQQVGSNLFHSFGLFSIQAGESATFSGPNSVNNIISRVTGGQISTIDGALRSTIPGANLYLLNPAGVLFGENAALDVPGSVHVSTADYLRLGEGGRFDARTTANSLLTVAPVEAFGFLSDAPGRIEANGSDLRVPRSQTLSLIGGDLSLTNSTLYVPQGRLNIVAAGSTGEVIPTTDGLELRGFNALGAFTLTQTTAERPTVNMGQLFGSVEIGNLDTSGGGGGNIFIRGGQWLNQGGWVFADTYGASDGGEIEAAFGGEMRFESGSRLTAATLGAGNGGAITLDVGTLTLNDGAFISTAAWYDSQGNGGDLTINAREAVRITGINDQGEPSALSADALDGSTGNAGAIRVRTPVLTLSDGGAIQSATLGLGDAGVIALDASTLTVDSGAYISTSTWGSRDAGKITLQIDTLTLTGGEIGTATFGAGQGGDLTINARESMTIAGAADGNFVSGIYTSAVGENATGNAGHIEVTTPRLTLDQRGEIIGESFQTSGGNITINAPYLKLLNGSAISSSVAGDEFSDGGNVTLNSINFVALNDSSVTARADQGRGGNITVNAEVFLHDATNVQDVLNASSQRLGNDGNVQNNAPQTDISGSLTVLPARYLDAAQISRRCGPDTEDKRIRFVVQGRGALLPPSPDEPLRAQINRCMPAVSLAPLPAPQSEAPVIPDPVTTGFGNR
jgi:filamentous hemagglutinin family protein